MGRLVTQAAEHPGTGAAGLLCLINHRPQFAGAMRPRVAIELASRPIWLSPISLPKTVCIALLGME